MDDATESKRGFGEHRGTGGEIGPLDAVQVGDQSDDPKKTRENMYLYLFMMSSMLTTE